MRHAMLGVFLWALMAGTALAQTATKTIPGYLGPAGQGPCPASQACFIPFGATTPFGTAQYGLSVNSATSLTVPAAATVGVVTIEGEPVRMTVDGTTPTSSVGLGPYSPGQQITLYGAQLAAAQFIGTTSGATLDVSYFR